MMSLKSCGLIIKSCLNRNSYREVIAAELKSRDCPSHLTRLTRGEKKEQAKRMPAPFSVSCVFTPHAIITEPDGAWIYGFTCLCQLMISCSNFTLCSSIYPRTSTYFPARMRVFAFFRSFASSGFVKRL